MKSQSNDKFKIKYKKDGTGDVTISADYKVGSYWTMILDSMSELRELADVIIDVLSDVQDVEWSEDDGFQLHSGD